MLPDDLAKLLEAEKDKRHASTAEVVREALEAYLMPRYAQGRRYSFFGIGAGGGDNVSERIEEILASEVDDMMEQSGLTRRDR
jgi:hypothetical protein